MLQLSTSRPKIVINRQDGPRWVKCLVVESHSFIGIPEAPMLHKRVIHKGLALAISTSTVDRAQGCLGLIANVRPVRRSSGNPQEPDSRHTFRTPIPAKRRNPVRHSGITVTDRDKSVTACRRARGELFPRARSFICFIWSCFQVRPIMVTDDSSGNENSVFRQRVLT